MCSQTERSSGMAPVVPDMIADAWNQYVCAGSSLKVFMTDGSGSTELTRVSS